MANYRASGKTLGLATAQEEGSSEAGGTEAVGSKDEGENL
jgi:hypothetical protein